jgi:hypothetical protein
MEDEIDLLENYETLPKPVQAILESWNEEFPEGLWKEADRIIEELEKIGYTADYGLCGELHSLQKI